MNDLTKAATIYDVAERAGVSHQTVSRYLRGYAGIRPATAQRVGEAVAELSYRANSAARQLRLSRANRVGVLAHDLDQAGPAKVIQGAFAEAKRRGYILDILLIDGNNPQSIQDAISLALEQRIAGILATAQSDMLLAELSKLAGSLPVGGEIGSINDSVLVNETAGWLAADHLIGLGHREIGFIGGPNGWDAARERTEGFERRLLAANLVPAWSTAGDWSAGSAYEYVSSLGSDARAVTAIAAANDSMAIGAIAALSESGKIVPDDVSVIGVDDLVESRFHLPSLSTVAMDHEGQGALSMSLLLDRIENVVSNNSSTLLSPPTVKARQSTARIGGLLLDR